MAGYEPLEDPRDADQVLWEQWTESDEARDGYVEYASDMAYDLDRPSDFEDWSSSKAGEKLFQAWKDDDGSI